MTHMFIDGLGVINEAAYAASDLSALAGGREFTPAGFMQEFESAVPSSKLRRCSRYIKMAVTAADNALKNGSAYDSLDPCRIGAVISSGYGASEYSVRFADSVVKHAPQSCSPSVFSQTVPNSCLGQICIINGFKGAGTFLCGGDPLEYAALLLRLGKADMMLCGQVEEWSAELFSSIKSRQACAGSTLTEGAGFLTLRTELTDSSCCEVIGHSSVNIGACPLIERSEGISKDLSAVLDDLSSDRPDIVFTAENGTWFDKAECRSVKAVFGEIPTASPKKLFGEALGSSYLLSVSLAAAALKRGAFRDKKCRIAVVTGFDMAGNYSAVKLSAIDRS
ncbi:MAG: hypothetical protein IJ555_05860 [Ruminococcus sp.]|nr:hypothetical protein [Ruminococcus sp.]